MISKNYIPKMVDFHTDALTLCRACNTRLMLAQLVWSPDPEVSRGCVVV